MMRFGVNFAGCSSRSARDVHSFSQSPTPELSYPRAARICFFLMRKIFIEMSGLFLLLLAFFIELASGVGIRELREAVRQDPRLSIDRDMDNQVNVKLLPEDRRHAFSLVFLMMEQYPKSEVIFMTEDSRIEAVIDDERYTAGSLVDIVNDIFERLGLPLISSDETPHESNLSDELSSGEYDDESGSDVSESDDWDFFSGAMTVVDSFKLTADSHVNLRQDMLDLQRQGYTCGAFESATGYLDVYVSFPVSSLGFTEIGSNLWRIEKKFILMTILFEKIQYPNSLKDIDELIKTNDRPFRMTMLQSDRSFVEERELGYIRNQKLPPDVQEFEAGHAVENFMEKYFLQLLRTRLETRESWALVEARLIDGKSSHQISSQRIDQNELEVSKKFPFWPATELYGNLLSMIVNMSMRRLLLCPNRCSSCSTRIAESIKPMQCEESLCFFRNLQLSGDTSVVEDAFIHDPYVMDLLISLAFAAAYHSKEKMNPAPLGLSCLQVNTLWNSEHGIPVTSNSFKQDEIEIDFSSVKNIDLIAKLKNIDKILIGPAKIPVKIRRVSANRLYVDEGVKHYEPITEIYYPKECALKLDDKFDYAYFLRILNEIPNVAEIRTQLLSKKPIYDILGDDACLKYQVIRWIYTTNRAVIHLDNDPSHRILQDPSYLQFTIQMGSAEKEISFQQRLDIAKLKQPVYGFHGSSLGNWHGILRQGLHYNYVAHGRAFGDGIYLSSHFSYSLGYSAAGVSWSNSLLKGLTNILALCELVDHTKYRRKTTQFYVMSDVEAVQLRYLFVRAKVTDIPNFGDESPKRDRQMISDLREFYGTSNERITEVPNAKERIFLQKLPHPVLDGAKPVDNFKIQPAMSKEKIADSEVEFEPWIREFALRSNRIDWAAADSGAVRILQREITRIYSHQQSTPRQDLDYVLYVSENNMFHWMIKLINFSKFDSNSFSLVKDMKQNNIDEVLLEAIFPKSFPTEPPFIRVITPMFNPRTAHVTINGAICIDVLTNAGWNPTVSFDSVMMAIRENMLDGGPSGGTLRPVKGSVLSESYPFYAAVDDFQRVSRQHGWQLPSSFSAVQNIARQ